MEAKKTIGEQMDLASQLEAAGRLADAAAIYQKLFNSDPTGQQVIGRLLVMYRKLKDYRRELSVLNDVIAASQLRQKTKREQWIQANPKAARAGRSMLRQLEKDDDGIMSLGTDPAVERWIKRKNLVASRITGKKAKKPTNPGKAKKAAAAQKKAAPLLRKHIETKEKQRQQEKADAAKKKASRERAEAAARRKRKERERKAAEASRKKEEQEQRKAEAARQKAEAERQKAETQRHPSLFVIILRYLVSLEEIDTAMKQHIAYLDKHYDKGDFLVSGRQVPRTGGVILACARNRNALDKIIKQDPFVKRKLASADIIEFTASQFGKGLQGWLKAAARHH
jgi:uncharacterized protein YciI